MNELEEINAIFSVERHNRFFPGFCRTVTKSIASRFSFTRLGSHFRYFYAEQLFDGIANLNFRGQWIDLECILIIPVRAMHPLLRHQRTQNDLVGLKLQLRLSTKRCKIFCLWGHDDPLSSSCSVAKRWKSSDIESQFFGSRCSSLGCVFGDGGAALQH